MSNKIRNPEGILKPAEQAVEDWYNLARPLEQLGFEVHGYDPGISFRSQCSKGKMATFTICVDDLKIINKAIKTEV